MLVGHTRQPGIARPDWPTRRDFVCIETLQEARVSISFLVNFHSFAFPFTKYLNTQKDSYKIFFEYINRTKILLNSVIFKSPINKLFVK